MPPKKEDKKVTKDKKLMDKLADKVLGKVEEVSKKLTKEEEVVAMLK